MLPVKYDNPIIVPKILWIPLSHLKYKSAVLMPWKNHTAQFNVKIHEGNKIIFKVLIGYGRAN